MNWNQVSCDDCWETNNPGRQPFRMTLPPDDEPQPDPTCSWCGKTTNSGIYVRADPRTVPFPQPDD